MYWFSNYTNSTNATSPPQHCHVEIPSASIKAGLTIGYSLVLFFSVLGNSLVMAIVYRNSSMRTPANYFIANMAFADLFVPVFLVPKTLVQIFQGDMVWLIGGKFGLFLCKLTPFVYDVCLMVSIHSLVLVAFERFYAVVRPMRAAIRNTKRCVAIIITTWLLSLSYHAFYFYCFEVVKFQGKNLCIFRWEPAFNTKKVVERSFISMFILFYAFPLLSITLLYFIIILKLKRQKIPGTRYGNMIINRQKRIVNTFRMVMTVVLAFFICWTPSKVYAILVIYHWKWNKPCSVPLPLEIAVYILAFSNNAITPYIYFIFNENYRNGLKGLLPWYEKPRAVFSLPVGHGHSRSSSVRSGAATTRVSFKQTSSEGESASVIRPSKL